MATIISQLPELSRLVTTARSTERGRTLIARLDDLPTKLKIHPDSEWNATRGSTLGAYDWSTNTMHLPASITGPLEGTELISATETFVHEATHRTQAPKHLAGLRSRINDLTLKPWKLVGGGIRGAVRSIGNEPGIITGFKGGFISKTLKNEVDAFAASNIFMQQYAAVQGLPDVSLQSTQQIFDGILGPYSGHVRTAALQTPLAIGLQATAGYMAVQSINS